MTVRVQREPFDIAAEVALARAARTDIGAIVTFTGTVRDTAGGGPIATMTLEHYPGMTEAELERIEAEARARWPLQAATIIHRYGDLAPGDDIVLVVTASAHRHAAFDAAAFLMDFLKSRAPFWKKEAAAGDKGSWVDARETDDAALSRWRKPSGDAT
jgi:molybdopterin synthase catalytic subunit